MSLKSSLTDEQFKTLLRLLKYNISEFVRLGMLPLTIEEIVSSAHVKITLFCDKYKHYTGVPYKVSAADSGKMKHVEINESLLNQYFTSDNFLFKNKYSISNLVKYYNELLVEYKGVKKSKFPNVYDRDFEKKLSGQELMNYWSHLRQIGLKPVHHPLNNKQIIDWK
jgi:hypothetical protein